MGGKILAAVIVTVFVLFFLSVFAPMHSEKKFWVTIRKIRSGMDLSVYWFFNLCAILSVLYLVFAVICGLLR